MVVCPVPRRYAENEKCRKIQYSSSISSSTDKFFSHSIYPAFGQMEPHIGNLKERLARQQPTVHIFTFWHFRTGKLRKGNRAVFFSANVCFSNITQKNIPSCHAQSNCLQCLIVFKALRNYFFFFSFVPFNLTVLIAFATTPEFPLFLKS